MQRVVERILNLLAFLLTVGRPITADEIRHTVAGYDQPTDEAFRRTFERDKDLLRQLGVPIRLEHLDAWEVDQGYVIAPDEYALPDPGLTDDERTALWLASQMVRLGGQAPDPGAILKLGGAPAAAAGEPLAADLGAEADALGDLFAAITEHRLVGFDYRGSRRSLKPYGLVHRMGHWYLVGAVGDDTRVFRTDRMVDVALSDESEVFEVPAGFRASDALPDAPWEAGSDDVSVEVVFDADIAWWARRQLTGRAQVTEGPDGEITAVFPVASLDAFIGWMVGFEDQAEILGPAGVRERFVSHVRAGS